MVNATQVEHQAPQQLVTEYLRKHGTVRFDEIAEAAADATLSRDQAARAVHDLLLNGRVQLTFDQRLELFGH